MTYSATIQTLLWRNNNRSFNMFNHQRVLWRHFTVTPQTQRKQSFPSVLKTCENLLMIHLHRYTPSLYPLAGWLVQFCSKACETTARSRTFNSFTWLNLHPQPRLGRTRPSLSFSVFPKKMKYDCEITIPQLERLDTGISQRSLGFNSERVHVSFVMGKFRLEQVLFRVSSVYPSNFAI